MFIMHMPWTFRLSDRAIVQINAKPATLWWCDADTLVINETDRRHICDRRPFSENLQCFICTDADGSSYRVIEIDDIGNTLTVPAERPFGVIRNDVD